MQGTNIFDRLEKEYRGEPRKSGQMFEDSRVESNIIYENEIQLFISGDNIKTIGGDKGDGITGKFRLSKGHGLACSKTF